MIVYTVIGCVSGGSTYSLDDAYLLGVFTDLQEALDCFEAEIAAFEPEEKTDDFVCRRTMCDSGEAVYEFSDDYEECHGIIKVIETILKVNKSSEEISDVEYDEDYERSWGPIDSTED